MKPISNWENIKAAKGYTPLPAGGYVCQIQGAKIKEYQASNGGAFEKMEIALDIYEGEFKGFYQQDFDNQNTEGKRWKGVLRLFLPKNDGTERDHRTASIFKAVIEAVEDSNNGYHWDWDERKLKGKTVGCLFRLEEWEYNGQTGWKAQPFRAIDAEAIRQNKFSIPKEKALSDKQDYSPNQNKPSPVDDDDLPF